MGEGEAMFSQELAFPRRPPALGSDGERERNIRHYRAIAQPLRGFIVIEGNSRAGTGDGGYGPGQRATMRDIR